MLSNPDDLYRYSSKTDLAGSLDPPFSGEFARIKLQIANTFFFKAHICSLGKGSTAPQHSIYFTTGIWLTTGLKQPRTQNGLTIGRRLRCTLIFSINSGQTLACAGTAISAREAQNRRRGLNVARFKVPLTKCGTAVLVVKRTRLLQLA